MSCFHKAQPLGHNSHGIDACVCLSVFMYVCPHPEDAWTFRNLLDSLNRQNYHIKKNKSGLRVKLNLLKCADSSLNTIRHISGVMSPASPVTSNMSLCPQPQPCPLPLLLLMLTPPQYTAEPLPRRY